MLLVLEKQMNMCEWSGVKRNDSGWVQQCLPWTVEPFLLLDKTEPCVRPFHNVDISFPGINSYIPPKTFSSSLHRSIELCPSYWTTRRHPGLSGWGSYESMVCEPETFLHAVSNSAITVVAISTKPLNVFGSSLAASSSLTLSDCPV